MPYKPMTHAQLTIPYRPVDNRPSAYHRGYTGRWNRERGIYLQQHPLCVECIKQDKTVPATVVDHIIPHKGDYELMWNRDNWNPLCEMHHNQKTGREQHNYEFRSIRKSDSNE